MDVPAFTEDWEETKRRWDAFWDGGDVGRCLAWVTAPRERPLPGPAVRAVDGDEARWTDFGYRRERLLAECARTFFGGEAFPRFWCDLGPNGLAGMLGARPHWDRDTVWFDREPLITDWERMPDLSLRRDGTFVRLVLNMTRRFAAEAAGRYVMGVTTMDTGLDVLAAMRGTQRLLTDLYDCPERVHEALRRVDAAFAGALRWCTEAIGPDTDGYTAWMPLWAREPWHPIQCDFAAMVSPEMFREFVVPCIRREAACMRRRIFHLDGPRMTAHLDVLLAMDDVDAVQWEPGDGASAVTDPCWYPMYRRIQEAGKRLILLNVRRPWELEGLLRQVSRRGLLVQTDVSSEGEARSLLLSLERWSVVR